MRNFDSLSTKEIVAFAISLEEENSRIYESFADALQSTYPETASDYKRLGRVESNRCQHLLEVYQAHFGSTTPLIRRQDIQGFASRKPIWLMHPFNSEIAASEAKMMASESKYFYENAARRISDKTIRQLLADLSVREYAQECQECCDIQQPKRQLQNQAEETKSACHRFFLLQVVQPGLVGLMDGSVSTLAPVFAAALATHKSWETFLVGVAASIGAGISMGFAEALSDDGTLTGRGQPLARGSVCGSMTILGGIGHTLPYLIIHEIEIAIPIAIGVAIMELFTIAWIRHKYMATPWSAAVLQVVAGGLLVFLTGMLVGSS